MKITPINSTIYRHCVSSTECAVRPKRSGGANATSGATVQFANCFWRRSRTFLVTGEYAQHYDYHQSRWCIPHDQWQLCMEVSSFTVKVLFMHERSCLCKVNINRVYSFCMDLGHLLVGQSKYPVSVGEISLFNLVGSNWLIRLVSAVDIRWSSLICLVSVNRVGDILIKPLGNGMDRRLSSPSSPAFIFNNRSVSSHNVVSRADQCSPRNEPNVSSS